jgi:L-rhamnose-H+ transport protein
MDAAQHQGLLIVVLSGLVMGTSPWPLKLMRRYRYEHFGLISMFFGLVVLPWAITLICCPHFCQAVREIPEGTLWKANAFTLAWGIAQVLAMQCFVRIGVSLTYGILCAVGAAVGVIIPMILKGSGPYANAPDVFSTVGLFVLAGLAIFLVGVWLASLAGFGREKALRKVETSASASTGRTGSFAAGLAMVVTAGVLSTGWGLVIAYCQDPIITAVMAQGTGHLTAGFAFWALVLSGAAVVNILYPVWLLTKNRSWSVIGSRPGELGLALLYGTLFFIPSVLLGEGIFKLGSLGPSIGWGIVQGMLILGGQLLGFIAGEWRGVTGRPRTQIYSAVAVLVLSMVILAVANSLKTKPTASSTPQEKDKVASVCPRRLAEV